MNKCWIHFPLILPDTLLQEPVSFVPAILEQANWLIALSLVGFPSCFCLVEKMMDEQSAKNQG